MKSYRRAGAKPRPPDGTLLALPALMKRALALAAFAVACSPITTEVRMPNPARTTDHLQARQSYEVGPFKEDHLYELTLKKWTPQELDFGIHLINVGNCGQSGSYVFTLVDDQGHEYPMRELGPGEEKGRSGHAGSSLRESLLEGAFAAAVGPTTKSVVVRIRSREDAGCNSLDFKWLFE
jgi:hypothetical protein